MGIKRQQLKLKGGQIPQAGEVRKRHELANNRCNKKERFDSFIYSPCEICGKPRWVALRKGAPLNNRCKSCVRKGMGNGQWKGGRVRNADYTLVLEPSHHRATKQGYVLEHILVWEKSNNRILPNGREVHHVNGLRSDNRPSNLIAMPSRKHKILIPILQKRIQELEGQLRAQGQLI